jgi:amino acid adenylation domain-containing protein/non-ribosomal peptide synthase protein (TIGR01720 family)
MKPAATMEVLENDAVQGFRLSPAQRRLWSLQSSAPESVYCCQCALRVHGDLDRATLEAALGRVVERNEILRTAFSLLPGMSWPLQVIQEPRAPRLGEVDLRGLDEELSRREIDSLLGSAAHRGFDLAGGDVLRASLVELAGRERLLLLSLPALCADPATLRNLAAQIARACAVERDDAAEPEPPLQYADIAEWQNQSLDSPDALEGIERWREFWRDRKVPDRLAGRIPLEAAGRTGLFEPASVPVPLEGRLSARLDEILREWACSGPELALACWQALLWKTTGEPEVLVGVLLDGRGYEELRGALGPLAAYLPVHLRLEEELRMREVVARVRAARDDAAAGQDSFSWQHLDGSPGGEPPFFPFCFVSEEPWEDGRSGRRLSLARQAGALDRFHLELVCRARARSFELELRYDRARFHVGTADLLAERLGALLESLAQRPEAPLGELDPLGRRERSRLFAELSNAPAAATGGSLHRLFEEQVRRAPDRPAVVSDEERLTYAELNTKANRLARHLKHLGVGPEIPVGICLPRSAAAVTAILAVLKAGGFWVPLDPALPEERLRFILVDTAAPVVLTATGGPMEFPGAQEVLLDAHAGRIAAQPGSDLPDDGTAPGLAYAIYTSGSTGRPKGVLVEHGAPINLLAGLRSAVLDHSVRARQRPLRASLNAPLAFDASVQQLVLLLAGHTLHVIPEEVRTDGAALLACIGSRELDLFDCTPSQLRLLLAAGLLEHSGPVPEIFLVAGEAIDPALWETLRGAKRTVFYNIYGPTECTVDTTAHRIGRAADGGPTIGRPLRNYEIYLLDRGQRPVPLGAPGEICVGGAGLARGYVGRPEATAEGFVPHPFASRPGARLYRTGDLARYRLGGDLEFLGRVDHQVKIRGYRVELGEIETALAHHPWVQEAVVAARQDAAEPAVLVAYVIPAPETPAGSDLHGELHRFLRQTLPVYMVPIAFVPLAAFPLTPSGKVDRRALPAPERGRPERGDRYVAPRNPVEETLAGIWRQTLRVEKVGIEDNFFELGGDSILSIQVISRAALAGLRITARQMFEHQTVAGLARIAEAAPVPEADSGMVAGPVPLTPIQHDFFARDLPHPEHFNQSVLLENATEERLSVRVLRRALGDLALHHDALRMRFEPPAPGRSSWRQVNAGPGAEAPLAEIDLAALPEEARRAALEEAAGWVQGSLDLAAGPLLRAVLFHRGADRKARLLLAAHHLVIDGVSWRILLEDLETGYRQLARGEAVSWPPKTTSFRRWAERLAATVDSAAPEGAWWLQAVRRSPGRLPRDREVGTNDAASARAVRVALDAEETQALLQAVPRAYRTQINDVLLTALVEAFAGWTGDRRLLVDLEGHGREEIFADLSVSRTVGWFTTVFPVLLDLDGIVAPGAALKAVKEQLRAIPERGIGYGLLRSLGSGEDAAALRSARGAELIFNYLGQFDTAASAEHLFRIAPEPAGEVRHPRQPRPHLLEVDGSVAGGRLWLNWTYSENRHRRETVEGLAGRFLAALRVLIRHALSQESPEPTPSDFPLAGLDQRGLDRALAALDGEVEDLYPLSPLQHGMLFHSIDTPAGAYFRQWGFTLEGDLDLAAFQRACQGAVDHHPVLRTAFLWQGLREPLQAVLRRVRLPVEVHDLRDVSEEEREERLAALRREDRERGFDLARAPLMRLAFIRLGPLACRVIWSFHHLVLDGWSFPRLVAEVFALYADARRGAARESEQPRPFRDYISWLRRQDLTAAERFWRRELAGFHAVTPLAADREPREPAATRGEARREAPLSAAVTAALQAWARRHQLTLNTAVQGAWALLLSRYSGERDVVFGAVTSGRSSALPGIETMLGVFINTLPVRAAIPIGATLVEWLRALQERQAEARELEHSPLAQVQGWSEIPRGQALFESLLAFENYPMDDTVQGEGDGPRLRIVEVDLPEATNYPLSLMAAPGPRLLLRLVWHRSRFDPATIDRRLRHLATLLEGFVEHGALLADVPMLAAAERHQLRVEWNDTASALELLAAPGRFALQAASTPDAVALTFAGDALTYRELNRSANRVAHHLRRRGVRPGAIVGLCLERSLDLVAGLLGIWKAGAAYVPLDPAHPLERLAFLVEDTGAAFLLTQERWAAGLRGTGAIPVVVDGGALAAESDADPEAGTAPADLAYVIYTSGSTGRPKGVMVEHGQLANVLAASRRELGWHAGDAIPCVAAASFDIFLFELLNPLLAGGRCALVPLAPTLDLPGLAGLLPEMTRVHAVPAVMRQLVEACRRAGLSCPGLRTLFVGGDSVPPDLLAEMRQAFPAAEVRVLYGPTEGTIIATSWPVPDGGLPVRTLIGRPLANLRVDLRDPEGRPVPIGAAGEIWIGGAGVTRGYLGREELTARSYPVVDGKRYYRTGDLARRLPAGELEFLGRADHQVKIRGVRIEPEEIEAVLSGLPGVRAAAVVAREDLPGGRGLVAFFVPGDGPEPDSAVLREGLRAQLPESMIPARFVRLDELPLTAHDKVDRRSLTGRGLAPEGAGEAFTPPRTPVEELLAGIFGEVLQAGRVGAFDDFFALGGHSLLATQVISRARAAFGVELPLRALFESPAVAALGAVLETLLAGEKGGEPPEIAPVPRGGSLPLSFAQERLWFLDQLDPGSALYNVPLALGLRGNLSPAALAASLSAIVARHETLRTSFPTVEGRPAQAIAEPAPLVPLLVDLGGLPAGLLEAETSRLSTAEAVLPFDLGCGPLLRTTLLKLAPDHHIALLTLHHIVSDGWSIGVLVREMTALYGVLSRGLEPALPPLPVQYADFAAWQRSWLSGEVLEAQLAWWRQRLAGVPAVLALPLDRPRPAAQRFRAEQVQVHLPPELSRDLAALARSRGATLYIVLLAAFQALLARLSGEEDLTVGSPIANRNRIETEGLIGFFVNTLVLRGRLAGDPAFAGTIDSLRELALGAYAHQDLPFEKLVEELRPERSLVHTPLFQVMFILQNAPLGALELPGLSVEPAGGERALSTKFDLTLALEETPRGLAGSLRYNPDLFDPPTALRMTVQLATLLAGAVARPESRLSELPSLSAAERHQLRCEWNDTGTPAPEQCLHELVEEQARRTPGGIALEFAGETLTFAALDCRASRLAARLRELGAGPEVPVGIAMERSLEMAVAVLAALKAGGCYVPLDPELPRERLAFLLADARPGVLLAQERFLDRLPEGATPWLCLQAGWTGEGGPDLPAGAGPRLSPDNLACILYTSGSTGRPKGVALTHRGLVNRLLWAQRTYPLHAADRVLQKAPFIFDFSLWELFAPLLAGARVVLASPGGHRDAAYLVRTLVEREITVAHFVPSLLRVFLDEEGVERCDRLRLVFSGGEALTSDLRDRFAARFGMPLRNQYGPTEASIDVTYWLCRPDRRTGPVPIGRPVDNTRLHLLDRAWRPVAAGVAGELCIGGAGLARGYLGRPDLTAERFIPDPWSSRPGERIYRSGDLARRLPAGEIEYLGRLDHQVKIRGLRIELGEIEAVLGEWPGLREAVVVAREDGARPRLVAYVAGPEPGFDPGELQGFLASRLPAYMVPAAFVALTELPRTATGKVDRQALPAPERLARTLGSEAPRTPVERILARAWVEVLRLPEVGVHDNFFELGGDSILSIQIVARVAREGYRITPRQVFEHQTIAALAEVAETRGAVETEQGPVTGPVLLTPIQRRFLDAAPVDPHHFNQSVLLAVRGPLPPATAERALAALARHHDALRLRLAPGPAGWTAWNAAPDEAPPAWARIDLAGLEPAPARAELSAGAALAQASLDLAKGPLVRGLWLDLPEGEARLFLLIHHLAVDGVSWRVLLEDLETACRQLGRGEPVSLPAKTTSFQAWSRRLSEHAGSVPLEPRWSWWLAAAEPGTARLPLDDPQGEDTEASTSRVGVMLTAEETRALLQEIPAAFRTQINDTLLTALALTLAGPGGSLSVALEGHGREEIAPDLDLSRTVGWFTTVFPVRLEIPALADLVEALQAVKEYLRSLPERGLGYGLLRHLRGEEPARRLAEPSWPEVSFNYLGQFDQVLPGESLFVRAGEPTGSPRSPRARRTHRVDVVGLVAGDRLRIDWSYGGRVLRRSTVERFAERFAATLRELIAASRSAVERGAGSYTPSDFPLAGLDRQGLADLLGEEWGVEDVYPLSPLQEGLLFHTLYDASPGVYLGQVLARLEGALDEQALEESCRRLIARHPILRTSFHWRGPSRPLQVVHGAVDVEISRQDWRLLPPGEREERRRELLRADRERGFDLSRAPLMRWVLVRAADEESYLLWSHHHLLLDGWSFSALTGELLVTYATLRRGEQPDLPRRRPYRDYIAWIESQEMAAMEEYWRRALAGWEPVPLPLVQEGGRGPREVATRAVRLSPRATAALQTGARRHQLTISTLAQGAWGLLLGRYSGRDDVMFGATVSGRSMDLAGIESMVGLFINTLPVRLPAVEGRPILSWLQELQKAQSELRQYEHSPLVRIQEWSRAPRGQVLFESLLVVENYPLDASMREGGTGLGVADVWALEQTSYPLTAIATPGEELLLRVEYDRSRVDDLATARLVEHFRNLLEGLVSHLADGDGGESVSTLPLLGEAERHQLLVDWNDPGFAPRPPRCLHDFFREQSARTPGAVALIDGETRLSYRELQERSAAWARALRGFGVGPEVLVGIAMERSVEMLVGILAVLEAGGAYVPLDPRYPYDRLALMLADSRVTLLLTQERLRELLPEGPHRVVAVDRDGLGRDLGAAGGPNAGADPGNAAYVIYTSGSTGTPKGVVIRHRNAASLVAWALDAFRPELLSGVLASTSICFDLSIFELFVPLATGGAVILAEDALALPRLPAAREVTLVNTVPSAARELVLSGSLPATVRAINLAGEPLRRELATRLYERSGIEALYNLYGPTEDTTYSTGTRVERDVEGAPTIGRPLDKALAYVLDGSFLPVPIGIAGEIWLGGEGLAREYLRRPDATAERFRPDPFGTSAGGRLYGTGDLGRLLPRGEIEFLGRRDHQVKIRGFRIELGEIEAALAARPEVRDAAVIVRDEDGDRTLVACLVPQQGEDLDLKLLRQFLRSRLLEPMVPSHFAVLEALPLTPSGKVDRKALARWTPALNDPEGENRAPRTPQEEILAGIFAEVLRRERVGGDDSFFDLGGHSLLATQVASRVRNVFGVELPLRALFENPTAAALARTLETFDPEDPERMPPPLKPVPRDQGLPLSFAQERLWFLDQLVPGSAMYNLPLALGIRGSLAIPALGGCLSEVVARHEALRTIFLATGADPLQVVQPPLPVQLPVVDLSGLTDARREGEARRLTADEAARPFDLARGPLMRATLLRLREERHIGLFTLHHIVADGWSMGVLVRELGELYSSLAQGRPPALPALPVQYADFAAWQRQWLRGEALEAQLAYWRECLEGAPGVLELPLDRPRPAAQSTRGATVHARIPEELSRRLAVLARQRGATVFMVLMAGLQAALSRVTGQRDLVIGSVIANRNRAETEELIGFFVNTLAFRGRIAEKSTFGEQIAGAREAALGAYAHQDLPFEKLIEELQPERSLAHSPLFQVMFVLQNAPAGRLELPGIALEPVPAALGGAKFDLSVTLTETPAGLLGSWHYSAELFDPATVSRLALRFEALLRMMAERPESALADSALLLDAERHQVLVEWNDTALATSAPPCVHEAFEAQARRVPAAIALVFEGVELTYGELNRRANRVARHLRRRGVSSGDWVGLCLERSLDLVAGLLGIWKAGAAYVPLDPSHPRERLALLLADTGASALLTRARWAELLRGTEAVPVCLDADERAIAAESDADPESGAHGRSLAYGIYTSGSTGRPKGVMVEHQNLAYVLEASRRAFGWQSGDATACLAAFSFDIFLFELLNPLLVGGRCTLVPIAPGLDIPGLAGLLPTLTRLHAVPAVMRPLTEAVRQAGRSCPGLRTLFVGGDAVSLELLTEIREVFPAAEIQVLYGPTEATIIATSWTVAAGVRPDRSSIGRPLPGAEILLCDGEGRLVPLGSAGEIWIGGVGVARGYLGLEELTARSYPAIGDRRFYRTGDLARWRAAGDLEFLGRSDRQVKIRGFRIEPGEIESALAAVPGVREAAVVIREDLPGGRGLAAYVVPETPELRAAALRDALRSALPEYMIPARFVLLEALPLTPHGKVDRQGLSRQPLAVEAGVEGEAVRSPVEEIMAGIFAEVLRREGVRRDDDFFALGGHSLLATQLLSRIRGALGVEIPLRAIFEHSTPAGLAQRIEVSLREGEGLAAPPFERAARDRDLPLSFAQQRLWFLDQLNPGGAAFNMPMAVRLAGRLDARALRAALTGLARRHEVLRTTFHAVDIEAAQVIAPASPADLPTVDLRALDEARRKQEARRLTDREARLPFDLERGPLLRVTLLRLAAEESQLLLTFHHIVSDGWSMGVFVRELCALYRALTLGEPPALPELPIQYADFAVWQQRWLNGGAMERLLAYWRLQLSGAPPVLDLPFARPRPPVQRFRGAVCRRAVSAETAEGLRALARQESGTLFFVLLAGFQALLAIRSGSTDVVVGTDIANRNRLETEGMIGFFVNQLVLRTDLSGNPTFRELLARVREVALGAYAHQDLPFDRLVEALRVPRNLRHSPLFQVKINLQNAPETRPVELPDLSLLPVDLESSTSQLDLNLRVADAGRVLAFSLEYDSDLFDAEAIELLLEQLEALLAAAAARPESRLAELAASLEAADRERQAARDREIEGTDREQLRTFRRRSAGERGRHNDGKGKFPWMM